MRDTPTLNMMLEYLSRFIYLILDLLFVLKLKKSFSSLSLDCFNWTKDYIHNEVPLCTLLLQNLKTSTWLRQIYCQLWIILHCDCANLKYQKPCPICFPFLSPYNMKLTVRPLLNKLRNFNLMKRDSLSSQEEAATGLQSSKL